jgi:hypothetical protein
VYTNSPNNLEEAHLRRHSTATYTYGGGLAYETRTPTAANICTSEVHLQRFTPRCKHFLGWTTTAAEDHCTLGVDLQSRRIQICRHPTISMMSSQGIIVMDIRSSPIYCISQFMNSMFRTDTEKGNSFDLLSIAALPDSPLHPDSFSELDSHQNWHT